jgi:hypothetical protein
MLPVVNVGSGATVRGFVAPLVILILAAVFVPLGIAYLVIGLAGGPDAFTALGVVFAAVGLAFLAGGLLLRGRARRVAREGEAKRTGKAKATVVGVELNPYVRIGSLVTVRLTVRFAPIGRHADEFSRRLHVSPLQRLEPGLEIDVLYDPEDPGNFLPAPRTA